MVVIKENFVFTKKQIEEKRQQVRKIFDLFGLKSRQYKEASQELYVLNLKYMDQQYRKQHGLSLGSKTPYYKELR